MLVFRVNRPRGFTIVELLIVIAIISFIAALLLPALSGAKAKGKEADCISRLKQIGVGYRLWANDNDGYFPWHIDISKGGTAPTADLIDWTDHYRAISNELVTPKVVACPGDDRKKQHDQWATLDGNRHISYFLGLDANESKPQSILAGDADIMGGNGGGADDLKWNTYVGTSIDAEFIEGRRHGRQGYIVLSDGSVHHTSTAKLRELISTALTSGSSTQVTFSLPRGAF
jgi:prepilin-type N-terminal cleavage/methylation domain-containing protein